MNSDPIVWCVGCPGSGGPQLIALGPDKDSGYNVLWWAKAGYTPISYLTSSMKISEHQAVWQDDQWSAGSDIYFIGPGPIPNIRVISPQDRKRLGLPERVGPGAKRMQEKLRYDRGLIDAYANGTPLTLEEARAKACDAGRVIVEPKRRRRSRKSPQ